MTEQPTEDTWREMGRQFQALGENLATAFRAAWEDEGNRQQLREVQAGLEAAANRIRRHTRPTQRASKPGKTHGHTSPPRCAR
jgi:hypothetical protein